jgi:hypothetical protein
MRKFPAFIAFILGVSVLIADPSLAAAPKSGAACPKFNQTVIVAGLKFTCIKSGKSLKWNVGIKAPSPVASSGSSKTTSTAPATLPVYPDTSGNPTPPIYPETEASRYIQNLIDTTDLSKSTNQTKVNWVIEPSTSSNGPYVQIAQNGVDEALKFYSAMGLNIPLSSLPVVLGRNIDWSMNAIHTLNPNISVDAGSLQGGVTLGGNLIFTNLVSGTIHTANPPADSDLSHVIETSDWAADIAHETFHVFQGSAPTKLWDTFPIWVSEGSAQLFGYMTGAKLSNGKITYNQEVEKYLDWTHNSQPGCSTTVQTMQPPCNYTQGMFVVEYFISKYHISGFEKLLHQSTGATFADQFLNATGDTLDSFYTAANAALKLRGWEA